MCFLNKRRIEYPYQQGKMLKFQGHSAVNCKFRAKQLVQRKKRKRICTNKLVILQYLDCIAMAPAKNVQSACQHPSGCFQNKSVSAVRKTGCAAVRPERWAESDVGIREESGTRWSPSYKHKTGGSTVERKI